jgi:hypothetical protein
MQAKVCSKDCETRIRDYADIETWVSCIQKALIQSNADNQKTT